MATVTNKWYDDENYSGSSNSVATVDDRIRTASLDIRERARLAGLFWPETNGETKTNSGAQWTGSTNLNANKWQVFPSVSSVPDSTKPILECDGSSSQTSQVLTFRSDGTNADLQATSTLVTVNNLAVTGTTATIASRTVLSYANKRVYTICVSANGNDGGGDGPVVDDLVFYCPYSGTVVRFGAFTNKTGDAGEFKLHKSAASFSSGSTTAVISSSDTLMADLVLASTKSGVYTETISNSTISGSSVMGISITASSDRFFTFSIDVLIDWP